MKKKNRKPKEIKNKEEKKKPNKQRIAYKNLLSMF